MVFMKALKTLETIKKYNWPYFRTKICELTLNYNCNARCVFCYSFPEAGIWKETLPLDIKTAIRYMLQSYKSGSRIIQIIGGEPTVYPELPKIVEGAKKIGYSIIQIVSNGQKLIDYSYIKILKEAGLNSITFSIHSSNERLHNLIVGLDDAFKNILKAIENAIKLDIYVTAGTAINALNYKNVPALVRFLHSNFGIESYHLIALHFIGGGNKNIKKLKVSYTQTLPYLKEALFYLAEQKILSISPILSNHVFYQDASILYQIGKFLLMMMTFTFLKKFTEKKCIQ